ncbi:hypothetical protein SAMN06296273_2642 [Nitrosomonas ureae]|uniref:Uncharacterized protein n=1 Tax=Nitrosomonas ureae TaxID=44577 RepID=A0A285C0S0_9PROT|nr:hypothetical protein SAMN06296273_2642 [Nitrosomonas ureae]
MRKSFPKDLPQQTGRKNAPIHVAKLQNYDNDNRCDIIYKNVNESESFIRQAVEKQNEAL